MQNTEIAIGTITVPLPRITPPITAWKPNTSILQSMMCNRCAAWARVAGSVMNNPSNQCDSK
ncbi:hypothetical protein D3C76_1706250 [compost metagenome]